MIVHVDAAMKPIKQVCLIDLALPEIAHVKAHNVDTHNQAEYLAIIEALCYGKGEDFLSINSDSELAVNQINSALSRRTRYGCNKQALIDLLEKVVNIVINRYEPEVEFIWIPREKNLAGIYLEGLK